MDQKSIFITGAANGIGRAAALHFAANGWFTGLADIDQAGLDALATEIGPKRCSVHRMDVTQPTEIQAALQAFANRTEGLLHVLFNNAGIIHVGPFDSHTHEDYQNLVEINLLGVIHTTLAALPYLKRTPGARIINTSSAAAIYGNPEIPVYAASKMGVRSLTEGWSVAFRKHDIRVSDIMPIFVRTRMVDDYHHEYANLQPDKVTLRPEDVAKIVWRAAHRYKLHWLIGWETKAYARLLQWLPQPLVEPVLRMVLKYE